MPRKSYTVLVRKVAQMTTLHFQQTDSFTALGASPAGDNDGVEGQAEVKLLDI